MAKVQYRIVNKGKGKLAIDTNNLHKVGSDTGLQFEYNGSGATWDIPHNLGAYPSAEVLDSSGFRVHAPIQHISTNLMRISFGDPFTGKAILTT